MYNCMETVFVHHWAQIFNHLRSPGTDFQPGGIDSLASIPGLLKRLKIRALMQNCTQLSLNPHKVIKNNIFLVMSQIHCITLLKMIYSLVLKSNILYNVLSVWLWFHCRLETEPELPYFIFILTLSFLSKIIFVIYPQQVNVNLSHGKSSAGISDLGCRRKLSVFVCNGRHEPRPWRSRLIQIQIEARQKAISQLHNLQWPEEYDWDFRSKLTF